MGLLVPPFDFGLHEAGILSESVRTLHYFVEVRAYCPGIVNYQGWQKIVLVLFILNPREYQSHCFFKVCLGEDEDGRLLRLYALEQETENKDTDGVWLTQ